MLYIFTASEQPVGPKDKAILASAKGLAGMIEDFNVVTIERGHLPPKYPK